MHHAAPWFAAHPLRRWRGGTRLSACARYRGGHHGRRKGKLIADERHQADAGRCVALGHGLRERAPSQRLTRPRGVPARHFRRAFRQALARGPRCDRRRAPRRRKAGWPRAGVPRSAPVPSGRGGSPSSRRGDGRRAEPPPPADRRGPLFAGRWSGPGATRSPHPSALRGRPRGASSRFSPECPVSSITTTGGFSDMARNGRPPRGRREPARSQTARPIAPRSLLAVVGLADVVFPRLGAHEALCITEAAARRPLIAVAPRLVSDMSSHASGVPAIPAPTRRRGSSPRNASALRFANSRAPASPLRPLASDAACHVPALDEDHSSRRALRAVASPG